MSFSLKKPTLARNTKTVRAALPERRSNDRALFQAYDYVEVTMADIEDLLECTHKMSHKQKKEYFYANGVDYDKVIVYYKRVKILNDTLYPPVSFKSQVKEYARIWGVLIMLLVHIACQRK